MIRAIEPIGDLYAAHGNDCWNAARDVEAEELGQVRDDWETVKVRVMLDVNRAKFAQNEPNAAELLLTGQARIVGCGDPPAVTSWVYQGQGHNWVEWNGIIMMIVREELRPEPQSNTLLQKLLAQIDRYEETGDTPEQGILPATPSFSSPRVRARLHQSWSRSPHLVKLRHHRHSAWDSKSQRK